MIATNKIKLNEKTYFKIILTNLLRKRWWMYVILWTMTLLLCMDNNIDSLDAFLLLFSILYPIGLFLQFRHFAYSKENRIFMVERYYEIDAAKIVGKMEDGTDQPILLTHFIKVIQTNKYCMLYISKSQFVYIPFSAFKSVEDKDWFDSEIIQKIMHK